MRDSCGKVKFLCANRACDLDTGQNDDPKGGLANIQDISDVPLHSNKSGRAPGVLEHTPSFGWLYFLSDAFLLGLGLCFNS